MTIASAFKIFSKYAPKCSLFSIRAVINNLAILWEKINYSGEIKQVTQFDTNKV